MTRGPSDIGIGIVAASEVAMDGDAPSRRVKLLPMGVIQMRDGRGPYLMRDLAHAQEIVAATQAFLGSADFNFDYDHQTVFAVKDGVGGRGKASGWTAAANLTAEQDGIYANDVEWTPAAARALADREYRYISPFFRVTATGEVVRLRNAALVNVGGIDLPAIAAALCEEDDMDLTAIAAALGLAATATAEEIAAAAADLKAKVASGVGTVAVAAGLQADAGVAEIAAAVTSLVAEKRPDLSGYVPAAIVEPMRAQLKTLNADRLGKKVDALVDAGIVPPAKRPETLAWFEKDEVAASAFFDGMPAIVSPGQELGQRKPGEKFTSLSADEVAACAAIGQSHADYLAAKNEEMA